jgi:hypothetical protein
MGSSLAGSWTVRPMSSWGKVERTANARSNASVRYFHLKAFQRAIDISNNPALMLNRSNYGPANSALRFCFQNPSMLLTSSRTVFGLLLPRAQGRRAYSVGDKIGKALMDAAEHPAQFEGTTEAGLRMLIFGKPVSRL